MAETAPVGGLDVPRDELDLGVVKLAGGGAVLGLPI